MSSAIKTLLVLTVCFGLAFCNSGHTQYTSHVGGVDSDHMQLLKMTQYALSVMKVLNSGWRMCPENATNLSQYPELLSTASDCFYNVVSTSTNESICHTIENDIRKCLQPMVDFFVDCFPEEAKDLPPTIAKGLTSVIAGVCTSSGEMVLELTNQCVYVYMFYKIENVKEQCTRKVLKPKLSKFDHKIPSKSEFCLLFRDVGDCWQDSVKKDCQSLVARKVFAKFYGAALAACTT